jgi:hypothetical protein
MFAALLGYNPIQTLLGPALAKLPASHAAFLTGRSFFPALISPAFSNGLHIAFDFAIAACLIAAVASLLRGRRYVHEEHGARAVEQVPQTAGSQATRPQVTEPQVTRPQASQDGAAESGPGESGQVESGTLPVTANIPEDSQASGLRR